MARILKHEIPAASEFTLPLHEGSKLLKLDVRYHQHLLQMLL